MIEIHQGEPQRNSVETNAGRGRHIAKSAPAFVVVNCDSVRQSEHDVVAPVIVVIANHASMRFAGGIESGLRGHVGKCAASIVAVKDCRAASLFGWQQQIWPAVSIDVDEARAGAGGLQEAIRRSRRRTWRDAAAGQSADRKTNTEVLRSYFRASHRLRRRIWALFAVGQAYLLADLRLC